MGGHGSGRKKGGNLQRARLKSIKMDKPLGSGGGGTLYKFKTKGTLGTRRAIPQRSLRRGQRFTRRPGVSGVRGMLYSK